LRQIQPARHVGPYVLRDEVLLELLLNLDIVFARDQEIARATYAAALPENSSEPSFDALVEDHWLRVIWGRISTSFEVSQKVQKAPEGNFSALKALLNGRFEETYRIADAASEKTGLAAVAAAIELREIGPDAIGFESPEWIAARLWDRASGSSVDKTAKLRLWVDRWRILGSPSLTPALAWSDADAAAYLDAVAETLEAKVGLVSWDRFRAGIIAQLAICSGQSPSEIGAFIPAIPASMVERALWLESNRFERVVMDTLIECESVSGIVGLALNEIEAADHALAPHPFAARLFGIATERAELFMILLFRLRASPKLLADVLLNPATSALGCLIVGQWPASGGAWDRELTDRDDEATKAIAFSDAVSVMGWFLEKGSLAPAEAAALLKWIHGKARPGFISDEEQVEPMLTVLRRELIGQSSEILCAVVEALAATMPKSGLGTPEFGAAVDVIDMGKLARQVDPNPVIVAYTQSVAEGAYGLSANRVSISGAAALFELAATKPELRQVFLNPVNIRARLAAGADENQFSLNDELSRSLRAHIRILCRAVAGCPEMAPNDLSDALISAVRSGALKHLERGRVSAFAPGHESNPLVVTFDRPIAADLGVALAALEGDSRDLLLAAILETDEPMVLAQLLGYAPFPLRAKIKKRAEAIPPSEAGEVWSLPDAQARIESLLSAGLVESATRFIEAERGLRTLGKVPGRAMVQLRSELRLLFIKGDWDGIGKTVMPAELSEAEKITANETIGFYKALAALNDPNGDRQGAEQLFSQLQNRRPEVAAYAINLFAVRLSLLLNGNLFAELIGDASFRGRQLLAEVEDMMGHARAVTPSDTAIFDSNKAILLLALGKPQKAIELLTPLRSVRLNDVIAAYTAVALARMGQATEAIASLDQAKKEFGDTDALRAARAQIEAGRGFVAVANTSSDDDPLPRIKVALWDFSQMDHVRQAEALKTPPDAFFSFVLDQVRFAAASLTSLVPMMNYVTLDSCENDLNALVGHLLASRLHFLNWTVPDQSLGGYTAAGNPGERDLVIRRDSAELAVIEAVICESSIQHQNLKKHFQKLFAYGHCRLFFHLTYAYLKNRTSDLMKSLQEIASGEAPKPFVFRDLQEIAPNDSRPIGFVARYAVEDDEAKVVFLILDMGQERQRQAAKA
jgi:tetratricopeptide (TPR) repeat protein